MAEQTNVTTEKIKYVTEGMDKVLAQNKLLQKVLNELEGASPAIVLEPKQTEEVKRLTERVLELEKALKKTKKETSSGWDWGNVLPGSYLGTGVLATFQRLGLAFESIVGYGTKFVQVLDMVFSGFLKTDTAALKLAASGGKVAKGWGWLGKTGKMEVSALGEEMDKASLSLTHKLGDLKGLGGIDRSRFFETMSGLNKAGVGINVLRGSGTEDMENVYKAAVDGSYLLTGSLGGLSSSVDTLGDFMSRFNLSATQADRSFKGIAIDAHAAGMGTERFLGSVRNISAEMAKYGNYTEEVSGLLVKFGRTMGSAFGEEGLKGMMGAMKGTSPAARLFMLQQVGPGKIGESFNKQINSLGEDFETLTSRITELSSQIEEGTRQGEDEVELGKKRSELEGRRLRLENVKSRMNMQISARDVIADRNASPLAKAEALKQMGPEALVDAFSKMLGGSGDFRDLFKNMEGPGFAKVSAVVGSQEQAVKILEGLRAIQGDKKTLAAAMESKEGKEAREKVLANLMKSRDERIMGLADNYQSLLEQLQTTLTNLTAVLQDYFKLRSVQKTFQEEGFVAGANKSLDLLYGEDPNAGVTPGQGLAALVGSLLMATPAAPIGLPLALYGFGGAARKLGTSMRDTEVAGSWRGLSGEVLNLSPQSVRELGLMFKEALGWAEDRRPRGPAIRPLNPSTDTP